MELMKTMRSKGTRIKLAFHLLALFFQTIPCKEPVYSDITDYPQKCNFTKLMCNESRLLEEDKIIILNIANEMRNRVAEGCFKYLNLQHDPVSNMNKLSWNGKLEKKAASIVSLCPQTSPSFISQETSIIPATDGIDFIKIDNSIDPSSYEQNNEIPGCEVSTITYKEKLTLCAPQKIKERLISYLNEGGLSGEARNYDMRDFWVTTRFGERRLTFRRPESTDVGCSYLIRTGDTHYFAYLTCIHCAFNATLPIIGHPGEECSEEFQHFDEKYENLCSDLRNEYQNIRKDENSVVCKAAEKFTISSAAPTTEISIFSTMLDHNTTTTAMMKKNSTNDALPTHLTSLQSTPRKTSVKTKTTPTPAVNVSSESLQSTVKTTVTADLITEDPYWNKSSYRISTSASTDYKTKSTSDSVVSTESYVSTPSTSHSSCKTTINEPSSTSIKTSIGKIKNATSTQKPDEDTWPSESTTTSNLFLNNTTKIANFTKCCSPNNIISSTSTEMPSTTTISPITNHENTSLLSTTISNDSSKIDTTATPFFTTIISSRGPTVSSSSVQTTCRKTTTSSSKRQNLTTISFSSKIKNDTSTMKETTTSGVALKTEDLPTNSTKCRKTTQTISTKILGTATSPLHFETSKKFPYIITTSVTKRKNYTTPFPKNITQERLIVATTEENIKTSSRKMLNTSTLQPNTTVCRKTTIKLTNYTKKNISSTLSSLKTSHSTTCRKTTLPFSTKIASIYTTVNNCGTSISRNKTSFHLFTKCRKTTKSAKTTISTQKLSPTSSRTETNDLASNITTPISTSAKYKTIFSKTTSEGFTKELNCSRLNDISSSITPLRNFTKSTSMTKSTALDNSKGTEAISKTTTQILMFTTKQKITSIMNQSTGNLKNISSAVTTMITPTTAVKSKNVSLASTLQPTTETEEFKFNNTSSTSIKSNWSFCITNSTYKEITTPTPTTITTKFITFSPENVTSHSTLKSSVISVCVITTSPKKQVNLTSTSEHQKPSSTSSTKKMITKKTPFTDRKSSPFVTTKILELNHSTPFCEHVSDEVKKTTSIMPDMKNTTSSKIVTIPRNHNTTITQSLKFRKTTMPWTMKTLTASHNVTKNHSEPTSQVPVFNVTRLQSTTSSFCEKITTLNSCSKSSNKPIQTPDTNTTNGEIPSSSSTNHRSTLPIITEYKTKPSISVPLCTKSITQTTNTLTSINLTSIFVTTAPLYENKTTYFTLKNTSAALPSTIPVPHFSSSTNKFQNTTCFKPLTKFSTNVNHFTTKIEDDKNYTILMSTLNSSLLNNNSTVFHETTKPELMKTSVFSSPSSCMNTLSLSSSPSSISSKKNISQITKSTHKPTTEKFTSSTPSLTSESFENQTSKAPWTQTSTWDQTSVETIFSTTSYNSCNITYTTKEILPSSKSEDFTSLKPSLSSRPSSIMVTDTPFPPISISSHPHTSVHETTTHQEITTETVSQSNTNILPVINKPDQKQKPCVCINWYVIGIIFTVAFLFAWCLLCWQRILLL